MRPCGEFAMLPAYPITGYRGKAAMKILVISDAWHPQVNGVVRTYQNLGNALARLGVSLDVFGPHDAPLAIPLPFYREIELGLFARRRLTAKILRGGFDRIHIATEGPLGRVARSICLKNNIAFSTCYHTHFPDYIAVRMRGVFAPLAGPLKKMAAESLRRFHAPAQVTYVATSSLQRDLESFGFKGPFHILSRGVDTTLFHAGAATVFDDMPRPVALYVGRVAVEKNITTFLDASWNGSKVVVGDGPQRTALTAKYPAVHFLGKKQGKDLADCYRGADIFVFPSRTDTFGMVMVEALACGIPVAAFPVTGPNDIVTSPAEGALSDDLGFAMASALKSSATRERRAETAQKTYCWDSVAKEFLSGWQNYV